MNFDWKAFEEGQLAYNARTEEDAKAFLAECEKRGFVWNNGEKLTDNSYFGKYDEICYECFYSNRITYFYKNHIYAMGKTIFSEPWKKQESVAELLRRIKGNSRSTFCSFCDEIHESHECTGRKCVDMFAKLADMVEAEQKSLRSAITGKPMKAIRRLIAGGLDIPDPKEGEGLKAYMDRTHVVLPRWDNDEIVEEGDPYGDTSVEHVCVYSDGDWLINMADGSTLEGTLNQRAVRIEPDTQERIDDESTMPPRAYLIKYGIYHGGHFTFEEDITIMNRHLLERQRKLDARTMGGEK